MKRIFAAAPRIDGKARDGKFQDVLATDFLLPSYAGWEQIVIREPNKMGSNKAGFKLSCKGLQQPGAGSQPNANLNSNMPNLVTQFSGLPERGNAGDRLGDRLKVQATNIGGVVAGGTLGSGGSSGGYMVDLVLSRSPVTATAFANFSASYSDGALLQGGRVSRTEDIGASAFRVYAGELRGSVVIPADTPSGDYYLCAVVDAGDRVRESNEADNITCGKIVVKGRIADKGQTPPD